MTEAYLEAEKANAKWMPGFLLDMFTQLYRNYLCVAAKNRENSEDRTPQAFSESQRDSLFGDVTYYRELMRWDEPSTENVFQRLKKKCSREDLGLLVSQDTNGTELDQIAFRDVAAPDHPNTISDTMFHDGGPQAHARLVLSLLCPEWPSVRTIMRNNPSDDRMTEADSSRLEHALLGYQGLRAAPTTKAADSGDGDGTESKTRWVIDRTDGLDMADSTLEDLLVDCFAVPEVMAKRIAKDVDDLCGDVFWQSVMGERK
jgi:hypothetical protein